jgi:hypothetical protein
LKPVILTCIAKADVERVALWYEKRKEGLGAELVGRVREAIGRIGENAKGYAKAIRQFRNFPRTNCPQNTCLTSPGFTSSMACAIC